jgi:8-oxo-dGTP pyrophosphatase MutT (NUDIX family)
MNNSLFHYIVRGIIRDGDHLLLCKQKEGDYTFLLGGHIDFGEGAKFALAREIKEEIGADVSVGEFRGAIENAWEDHCEISLVFEVEHNLTKDVTPMPASPDEEHLAFLWVKTSELAEHNLLPAPLIQWLQNAENVNWSSTIE